MKSTSHYALAAAAGLFIGGLAITPAKAADLGGDCCADLEERVAELEATTVRKSTRVVSVQLYGQINKALMIWDDGIESDVYVVDNDQSGSRFGLRGSAMLKPGWTAGFRTEFEFQSAASNKVSQDYEAFVGDDGEPTGHFSTRRASLYVESAQLGRVTMGLTSLATDDIVFTYLGSINVTGAEYVGGGLRLRTSDGGFLGGISGGPTAQAISISTIATDTDIGRDDAIRYDSPSLYGFIFSAAWGESDKADVALRFKKEWNSIQIVAAAGYRWDGDQDKQSGSFEYVDGVETETYILAGGIKHTPSGVFLNGVWVQQDRDDLNAALFADGAVGIGTFVEDEATYWSVFGGIEGNWTGHGLTSIFARYSEYEGFGAGTFADFDAAGAADDLLADSEVTVWGFGIEQDFDSAAMEIYAHFNYFESEVGYFNDPEDEEDPDFESADVEDVWVGYIGSRIKF